LGRVPRGPGHSHFRGDAYVRLLRPPFSASLSPKDPIFLTQKPHIFNSHRMLLSPNDPIFWHFCIDFYQNYPIFWDFYMYFYPKMGFESASLTPISISYKIAPSRGRVPMFVFKKVDLQDKEGLPLGVGLSNSQ
jgi:hypothetical protein